MQKQYQAPPLNNMICESDLFEEELNSKMSDKIFSINDEKTQELIMKK